MDFFAAHDGRCWETKSLFLNGPSRVSASDQPPYPHQLVTSLCKGSGALRLPAILSTCSAPESLLGVNP